MKTSTKFCIWAIICLTFAALVSNAIDTKETARIVEIRKYHKLICDVSRNSIQAGYVACRMGIPLTNYLAGVEAAWEKLLKEQISTQKAHLTAPASN